LKTVCLYVLIASALSGVAQKKSYSGLPSDVWPKLYNISYQAHEKDWEDFGKPVFSKEAQALAGKTVTLPGFLVPFETGMKSTHFMFTSLPLNACFFCGVGGPETVIEIFSAKPVHYTDKPVELRGRLLLNNRNPNQMIYILENAEFLGEIDF
jgi:hypothetical protein